MKKILKRYISLVRDDGHNYEEVVKTWDKNDRDDAVAYAKSEGLYVSNYSDMEFPYYALIDTTEFKERGTTYTENHYIQRDFALYEDTIKKYRLVEVDDYLSKNRLWPIYSMLGKFDIPHISVRVGGNIKHYTDLDKLKKLVESVNTEQQPLVIKGTDWPYWFNIEGKLIPSKTSNWFKYLQIEFDYVSPSSLVPYTGDDKNEEHLDKE